jgi:ADP-ribose pyrophosphatase YjhB (NUDIX family)
MWEFPGGKVEPGEQLREALVRELSEEFGIRESLIRVGRVLDSIDDCKTPATGEKVYRVTFFEVEFLTDHTELRKHTEARWMTPDEARAVPQLPSGTMFCARHMAQPAQPVAQEPVVTREQFRRLLTDYRVAVSKEVLERACGSMPWPPDRWQQETDKARIALFAALFGPYTAPPAPVVTEEMVERAAQALDEAFDAGWDLHAGRLGQRPNFTIPARSLLLAALGHEENRALYTAPPAPVVTDEMVERIGNMILQAYTAGVAANMMGVSTTIDAEWHYNNWPGSKALTRSVLAALCCGLCCGLRSEWRAPVVRQRAPRREGPARRSSRPLLLPRPPARSHTRGQPRGGAGVQRMPVVE